MLTDSFHPINIRIYIGTLPDGMVLIDFNETGLGAFQGTPLHKNGIVEFSLMKYILMALH